MAATDEAWQIVKRGEVITFTRSGNVVVTLTADPSKYPQIMNFRGWSAFTELGMSIYLLKWLSGKTEIRRVG